ncbi:MAG TPA: phosphomethylpyrimidine synthase ThiC, partial [Methanoregula sp.]|nr:phosphomethylpyrimidine synthase ThiC [Methanoregula sp.]
MITIADYAKNGTVTQPMVTVAEAEDVDPGDLCSWIAEGSAVIMKRGDRLTGIGRGLSTKINVNLGTSTGKACAEDEVKKALIAERFGAHTISDLSMGGDISAIRRQIFSCTTLPITTVPVYQAVAEHGLKDLTPQIILAAFEQQAEEGISSAVIHGVSRSMLALYKRTERILGMVSKGGSITSAF